MKTYHFRGKLNTELITADARKDDLFAFIVVESGKEGLAILGVTTEYGSEDQISYACERVAKNPNKRIAADGYVLVPCDKRLISVLIKLAEKIRTSVLKQRKKLFREARKNADKSESKVMCFGDGENFSPSYSLFRASNGKLYAEVEEL